MLRVLCAVPQARPRPGTAVAVAPLVPAAPAATPAAPPRYANEAEARLRARLDKALLNYSSVFDRIGSGPLHGAIDEKDASLGYKQHIPTVQTDI